jgi:hypothetical protein
MHWLYWFPHAWNPPEQRMSWADVLLLPDDPDRYAGQALWLTVDAILHPDFQDDGDDAADPRLARMGEDEMYLKEDTMDLAVRAYDFDRRECLDWVGRWLRSRFSFSELLPGPRERFVGRSDIADLLDTAERNRYP